MRTRNIGLLLAGVAGLSLAGCGGGGGANPTPYVPAPNPPPPAPPPTPTPPPPVFADSSIEFTSFGDDVRIRWDDAAQVYEILLPGRDWASLVASSTSFAIRDSSGATIGSAYFSGSVPAYTYTGIVTTYVGEAESLAVYGIPTAAAGVPVTGSASYLAELRGSGSYYSIGGTAQFNFDFGGGSLSGFMEPSANDPGGWGPYTLGRYDFVQTIYSTGSTTFSGGLSRENLSGSFDGAFTGPGAQELMGQWQFEFLDIYEPTQTITANGVFIGRRSP